MKYNKNKYPFFNWHHFHVPSKNQNTKWAGTTRRSERTPIHGTTHTTDRTLTAPTQPQNSSPVNVTSRKLAAIHKYQICSKAPHTRNSFSRLTNTPAPSEVPSHAPLRATRQNGQRSPQPKNSLFQANRKPYSRGQRLRHPPVEGASPVQSLFGPTQLA